ncbi:hypothetical protein ILUMI_02028 [Ignelater luminosus]|uniref:Uncharacterized protein n=1 Tax=Ignelater luminosus TaxID=2038154 RepID=A0A8K0GL66_IGNLU|nr:hypothetical protein ILUMI_02028 [Ignelater luminosus]
MALIHKDWFHNVRNWKVITDRLLRLDINSEQNEKMTIVVAYGPLENEIKEIEDDFWDYLQDEVDRIQHRFIIIGDLNGCIGASKELGYPVERESIAEVGAVMDDDKYNQSSIKVYKLQNVIIRREYSRMLTDRIRETNWTNEEDLEVSWAMFEELDVQLFLMKKNLLDLNEEMPSENQQQTGLIMKTTGIVARTTGQSDLAAVSKKVSKSPTRPSKIRKTLLNSEKFPILLNDGEALTFLLDNNFSKQQYINIRVESKHRNADIYPTYEHLKKAKLACRPLGLEAPQSVRFCRPIKLQYAKETKDHVLKEKQSIDEKIREDAFEARNKLHKKDRESHAGKDSHIHNLTDIFNRALETSDPIISSASIKKRLDNQRHKQLPREVIKLLACTEEPEKDTSETIFNMQDPQNNSESEGSDELQEENNTETFFKVLDTIVLDSEN